jgi:hypothetical protein
MEAGKRNTYTQEHEPPIGRAHNLPRQNKLGEVANPSSRQTHFVDLVADDVLESSDQSKYFSHNMARAELESKKKRRQH